MNWKSTITAFQVIVACLCLAILLFATELARITRGFVGATVREIAAVCRDDTCQWMLVVCLLIDLGIFLFWKFRERKRLQVKNVPLESGETPALLSGRARHTAAIILIALVVLCLVGYVGNYPLSARSLQILTLLSGIVVGRAFAVWVNFSSPSDDTTRSRPICRLTDVLAIIVGLLSIAALYQPDSGPTFAYHDIRRWTGPWDNPNLFGLLMGAGAVLAVGSGLGRWRMEDRRSQIANKNCKRKFGKRLFILLCLIAIIIFGHGLYYSWSRGAWLGTAVGLVYLIGYRFRCLGPREADLKIEIGRRKAGVLCHSCMSWLSQNRFPVIAIALSAFVVGFWQLRFSKFQPAQRIASVANPNDFSWRNRVAAWEGATRMIIDKPLTGFGWGEAGSVYAKRYCTTASNESGAIDLNDYLMMGISGGVPVMLCFIGYVALALTGKTQYQIPRKLEIGEALLKPCSSRGNEAQTSGGSRNRNLPSSVHLIATCRAGAIVLLVGFWFDGGLFKLPTAVVFWTLLELSRLEFVVPQTASTSAVVEQSSLPTNCGKPNRWLSRAAWCAVITAVSISSFYLFAPYLPVSEQTIAIARHYLILPKERADFDFLADKPIWHGQKLKTLMDQAELANYNRELINWQLDQTNYRIYVLSPVIDSSSILHLTSSDLGWRRPLWEAFYPLIRHESSPTDAAKIVVQQLHKRIAIDVGINAPLGITRIWQKRKTDETGFQMICVAALRSVGVPARLDADGIAEFYDGTNWLPVASLGVVGSLPWETN